MRAILITTALILSSLGLTACATTSSTLYGPVMDNSERAIGFSDYQIEDNRWRVRFTTGPDGSQTLAEQYALRRAAELSHQNGFDWFEIVHRRSETLGHQDSPVGVNSRFSAAYGSGGYSSSGVGVGISINSEAERRHVTHMEIIAGQGERPHIQAYLVDEILARYSGIDI